MCRCLPDSFKLSVRAHTLARQIAQKGSICVDGTNLGVNAVQGSRFELNSVSHSVQGIVRPADLIQRADEALYKANENGRNRVEQMR